MYFYFGTSLGLAALGLEFATALRSGRAGAGLLAADRLALPILGTGLGIYLAIVVGLWASSLLRRRALSHAARVQLMPVARRRRRRLIATLLVIGVGSSIVTPAVASAATPPAALVLYDSTGPYGWLGELYGIAAANLAGHFGPVKAEPVTSYTAGQLAASSGVIYVGSTYDEPLPTAFLDDVLAPNAKKVVWMYDNIWKLTARAADFTGTYGWNWWQFDLSSVAQVSYKGTTLDRSTLNAGGIMSYSTVDPAKATTLATAVRADGTTFPWALRSKNLTYIGEIPFSYTNERDRLLAFEDILYDVLAPSTVVRHRALVRLEDVGPDADPAQLRAAADYLASQNVPFSFGVYPVYTDPNGVYNGGVPETRRLRDTPAIVSAIKYMVKKGGTMIMHGYTHQYSNVANPYTGTSGDDFEFYTAHVDANNYVVYDGPVPGDSVTWAQGRIDSSFAEFSASGLTKPTIFEFPHYAGSSKDYAAANIGFDVRYERSLYFGGQLSGGAVNATHMIGQLFPYAVNDVYGMKVLPENLGNYEPVAANNNPPRLAADVVENARRNLVIRDGFASFFYHPYYGTQTLSQIVDGIKALGYSFVAAGTV